MSDEEPVSETFKLIEPPKRVDLSELPRSPKSVLVAAEACGWATRAWVSVGEVPPVLYMSNSDEDAKNPYNAGDVRFDGYLARTYTVEARDMLMPLGFQAHFEGKTYADEGRKPTAGSFAQASVVDPVGIPRELRVEYTAISQLRGKYETQESFQRRVNDAKKAADQMSARYNDGSYVFEHMRTFSVAGEFNSWLAEWRSFTTIQKAKA